MQTPSTSRHVSVPNSGAEPRLPRPAQTELNSWVRRYGTSSSSYVLLEGPKSYFTSHTVDGFLGYQVSAGIPLIAGDPVCAPDQARQLIHDFAIAMKRPVGAYQVSPAMLGAFRQEGFTDVQVGKEAIFDLKRFTLAGGDMELVRAATNKARREGVVVTEHAGNLYSTPQQSVVNNGPSIIVEPVDPTLCYLPTYNPWLVYGAPIPVYPGYIYDPLFGPPFISFRFGTPLGYFGTFGWGWPAWGFNWGNGIVVFHHSPFVSHSRIFINRFPGAGFRRFPDARGNFRRRNFFEGNRGFRSFGQARPNFGTFRGFARGSAERDSALPGGSRSSRDGFGEERNFGAVHSFGARGFGGRHSFAAGGIRGSGGHRR